MLVIRFFRVGKKNQPSFKIVVTDKRKPPRSGRFVEEVGFYNPLTKEKILKQDRIKYWLSVGAKPSDTAFNLLVSEKIITAKKTPVHKIKQKGAKEAISEKPSEEKPLQEKPIEQVPKEDISKTKEEVKEKPETSAKTRAKEKT